MTEWLAIIFGAATFIFFLRIVWLDAKIERLEEDVAHLDFLIQCMRKQKPKSIKIEGIVPTEEVINAKYRVSKTVWLN